MTRSDPSSSPAAELSPAANIILALDLGSTNGWAMRLADRTIVSGTMAFKSGRYEGGGMRYLRFRSWLDEMLRTSPTLAAVYFEEVRRHVGTDAAHVYGGFLAHLSAWCETQRCPYQGVPVGTIKRFIAGKGNADKQQGNRVNPITLVLLVPPQAPGARVRGLGSLRWRSARPRRPLVTDVRATI